MKIEPMKQTCDCTSCESIARAAQADALRQVIEEMKKDYDQEYYMVILRELQSAISEIEKEAK